MAVKYEMSTKVERAGKERWHKVGVVMENDKGMFAIIDSIPVGFTGMVSFFVPKEKDAPSEHQQAPVARERVADHGAPIDDDSIPF